MIVEIEDMTTPMLSVVARVNRNVAFEQMSKIGNEVRKRAKERMSYHRHGWMQKSIDGKLHPYYSKTDSKILGQRTDKDGSISNPKSIGNFISSNLMEESGVLIVGGRNRKKHQIKRKDGKKVGTVVLNSVTKHSQSIVHKLDTGERNSYHGWGHKGNDKKSSFRNAKFKGRHFMTSGFRDAAPYMKTKLTTEYEKIIGRAVNTATVRLTPLRRIV